MCLIFFYCEKKQILDISSNKQFFLHYRIQPLPDEACHVTISSHQRRHLVASYIMG